MTGTDHDPLDELIEDFLAKYRGGERPDVEDYAGRHPDHAARIRTLFPALVTLEHLGSVVGGATKPADAVGPGSVLGEYRLLREVGRGGMGVVYEAVQETLGRPVALKVMAVGPHGAGRFLDRFRREARTAARLHHTNIVPVFGVGADKGVYFYAMQFIRGQSLSAVLDEVRRLRAGSTVPDPAVAAKTPSPHDPSTLTDQPREHYHREITRLAAQAADALAHAHGQGVLHRDIKPANLLLDADGTLWVADFGLAKADDSDDLTETGNLVGTPRYMAPERFRGPGDARSDVYSLGATLYEMLTLRPAFDAADRGQLVEQITAGRLASPRDYDPAIERDLETVVLHAMARDPADRYSSAAALADDLRNALADRPISVRRPSWAKQTVRWGRRNPMVAGLATAVFGLLAAVAGVSIAKNRELGIALKDKDDALDAKGVALGEKDAALVEKDTALGDKDIALKAKDAALWQSLVEQARAARLSGSWDARTKAMAALARAADIRPDPSLRGEVFATLDLGEAAPDERSGASPDLQEVAQYPAWFLRAGGRPPPTRSLLNPPTIPTGWGEMAELRSDGDGRFVIRADGQKNWYLIRYDREGTVIARVARPQPGRVPITVTAAGTLVMIDDERKVRVYRTDDGSEVGNWGPLPASGRNAIPFAVSPGAGTELIVARTTPEGSVVEVRNTGTGKVLATIPCPYAVTALAQDLYSRKLAIGTAAGQTLIFDHRTQNVQAVLPGRTPIDIVEFHPDRELILTNDQDLTRVWDYRSGTAVATFRGGFADVRFGRDGRSLGWLGRRRFRLVPSNECRYVSASQPFAGGVVGFRPDGRYLICSRFGMADIVDVGRAVTIATHNDLRGPAAQFDADGKAVLAYSSVRSRYERRPIRLGGSSMEVATGVPFGPAQVITAGYPPVVSRTADGSRIAYTLPDSGEAVVERADGKPVLRVAAPELRGAVLSPRGRYLATVGRTSGVWEVDTSRRVYDPGRGLYNPAPAFAPDESHLALGYRRGLACGVVVLRTADWKPVADLPFGRDEGGQLPSAAFSSDGSLLAIQFVRETRLHRTDTWAQLAGWDEFGKTSRLGFSPDDRYLVLAGDGITIRDIKLVRERLRAMNLDWEPPFREAPAEAARP